MTQKIPISISTKHSRSKYVKYESTPKMNDLNINENISPNTPNGNLKSDPKLIIRPNIESNDKVQCDSGRRSVKSSNKISSVKSIKIPTYSGKSLVSKLHRNLANLEDKSKIQINLDKVKISSNKFGYIEAYAATTHQGLVRSYNEDRVSIILNISKPKNYTGDWPNCSFFGIYDGHAGHQCADFLRDNLHKFIIDDSNFPKSPQKAILNGFIKAEKVFMEYSLQNSIKSGSCALVIIIVERRCFVVNVGDSRAIMSGNFGDKLYVLSRDHRPSDEREYKRIIEAGGKIYQTEANIVSKDTTESILGPLRVSPGKLSVSRTIGDIEAKLEKFGGNENVIIPIPDIKYFEISDQYDFILIGCK